MVIDVCTKTPFYNNTVSTAERSRYALRGLNITTQNTLLGEVLKLYLKFMQYHTHTHTLTIFIKRK